MPKIRVVRVDLSSQAQVTAQRPVRGDRLINSSACRWTVGPDGRSVQPDHQRTPKAAVSWGGSFCFPLMAPRVNPDCDEIATLVASRARRILRLATLRKKLATLPSAHRKGPSEHRNPYHIIKGSQNTRYPSPRRGTMTRAPACMHAGIRNASTHATASAPRRCRWGDFSPRRSRKSRINDRIRVQFHLCS